MNSKSPIDDPLEQPDDRVSAQDCARLSYAERRELLIKTINAPPYTDDDRAVLREMLEIFGGELQVPGGGLLRVKAKYDPGPFPSDDPMSAPVRRRAYDS